MFIFAKGRHGLGTIYIVPAGPTGNELANNIYAIAVNGVGRHWAVPDDSYVSANVITSGLSSGSNISSSSLVIIPLATFECTTTQQLHPFYIRYTISWF